MQSSGSDFLLPLIRATAREGSTAAKLTHIHREREREREAETPHNGCWRMGAWISWLSHTQLYHHKLVDLKTHRNLHGNRHTTHQGAAKTVSVSQDSSAMNDLCSVLVFFSQTPFYDLRCLFNKTWVIRLRKSCEKERRRKRTTLLRISVIVLTHITFLAADSQPWERTLVNQTTPSTPHSRSQRPELPSAPLHQP